VMALLALACPADGWERWVFIGVAGLTLFALAVNRLVMPSAIGWTLGRALMGIAVSRATIKPGGTSGVEEAGHVSSRATIKPGGTSGVEEAGHVSSRPDGSAVGVVRLTLRELAHLLDTLALCVGWLWPLWDRRRRTFADLLARTEVVRVDPPQTDIRRLVAKVLAATAALCVVGVGFGYGVVYRYEQAADDARAQIADQGPRIVEQMLSYGAQSMADDFARAQGLTTDGYRPQLTAQQEAVQKAGATTNEYWTANFAVLANPPVTPDSASMLLAMQGRRGTTPETQKFITATVQVDFQKSGDGQWRVSNLTVLKKPLMNQAGQ